MQIYTRTGDQGTTRIIGGQSLYKDDAQIQVMGSLDELNSYVGLIQSQNKDWPTLNQELLQIQHYIFDAGSDFAQAKTSSDYRLAKQVIAWLEDIIDDYSQNTPELTKFVLPGGSPLAASLHYARSLTRRAERDCVSFIRQQAHYPQDAYKFINRLSDYFFAAARLANYKQAYTEIHYERGGDVFHPELKKTHLPKL
ncbi:cob(I)yrinic acid a,c-diamide adenosyltransferase [Ignavigranum ruoffiae]|uniref:Corrinoid adenosyltransferase n=1 Tax=Ignavigranum ruoffiae TaxID=89093 RepID=A0A1H9BLD3_9LACT|nr:cob(I)yrinic acid a,c-diamide adenosyltransferase [Ignavigranum ruoffiae]UPQ86487.1 cob(I)yrinic acid a,c-diamide adenosyltransferase [Ignavigranum ruoffiae]SEP89770.1 ATP:cob(I)alamin adenosyltransferase [Ignavigranum ruoffiae]